MSRTFRLLAAGIAAAGLAAMAPAVAAAQVPPAGRYDCVIGSSQIPFGTLVVKGGGAYRHRGTKGRIRSAGAAQPDETGTLSHPLRLKGGDLGGMRGRWYRTTSDTIEIALRNPRDDFESIYCDPAG